MSANTALEPCVAGDPASQDTSIETAAVEATGSTTEGSVVYLPFVGRNAVEAMPNRDVTTVEFESTADFAAFSLSLFRQRGLNPTLMTEAELKQGLRDALCEFTPTVGLVMGRDAYEGNLAIAQQNGIETVEDFFRHVFIAIAHMGAKNFGVTQDFQPYLSTIYVVPNLPQMEMLHLPSEGTTDPKPYNVRTYDLGEGVYLPQLPGINVMIPTDYIIDPENHSENIQMRLPDGKNITVPIAILSTLFCGFGYSHENQVPGLYADFNNHSGQVSPMSSMIVEPYTILASNSAIDLGELHHQLVTNDQIDNVSIVHSHTHDIHGQWRARHLLNPVATAGVQIEGTGAILTTPTDPDGKQTVPEAVIDMTGYTVRILDSSGIPVGQLQQDVEFVKVMNDPSANETVTCTINGGGVEITDHTLLSQETTGRFWAINLNLEDSQGNKLKLPISRLLLGLHKIIGKTNQVNVMFNTDIDIIIAQYATQETTFMFATRLQTQDTVPFKDSVCIGSCQINDTVVMDIIAIPTASLNHTVATTRMTFDQYLQSAEK